MCGGFRPLIPPIPVVLKLCELPVLQLVRVDVGVMQQKGGNELIFFQLANADPHHLNQDDLDDLVIVPGVICLKTNGDPWSEKCLGGRSIDDMEGWVEQLTSTSQDMFL